MSPGEAGWQGELGRDGPECIPGGPSGWLTYVQVGDIYGTTQKAKSLGAEVMKEVTEVMGMGRLSFIRDPTGAILGLWHSKSK